MNRLLILLAVLAMSLAIEPPVYNYSYKINFDESFIQNKTTFRVNGQFIYDPANNRERVDRTNGRYDLFCGSVLPNQTTPCNQIVVDSKRWLVFPAKSSCCFCCDASHGCGILRPDWLNGAEYLGQEKLIDTLYNKWSKPGTHQTIQDLSDITTSGPRPTKTKSHANSTKTETTSAILTPTPSTIRPCLFPMAPSPYPATATSTNPPTAPYRPPVESSAPEPKPRD